MSYLFINELGRIRSGWRFLIFFIVFSLVEGFGTVALLDSYKLFGLSTQTLVGFTLPFFIFGIVAIALGGLFGWLLEGLPFRAIGAWFTSGWLKDLLLGFLVGALSLCLAALLAMVGGGLTFQVNQYANQASIGSTLAASLAVFLCGAMFEEAVFRGYMVQTFARAKLIWFGVFLTSVPFALAHLANDGANWISSANTFLAGMWFGVAYMKTRTLWFPFGIHVMWNWVQGAVLGINVSGIEMITPNPMLRAVDSGPAWLTGGQYGIEGGLMCTIALIISGVAIWFLPIFKADEEMFRLTNEERPNPAWTPTK
jgi:membrane protease YdiL (CAAX protease family)